MESNLQTAIDVLKNRIRSKEEDLNRLKRTVNEMCQDACQEAPYTILAEGASDLAAMRSDIFYGHAISGAAKLYLEMRRNQGAASVNEIYTALKTGGFKFEAKDDENAKNGLRISLRKNSSIFHRLPAGDYGLLSWYPNAKPPKDDDDEDEPKPAKAAKTTPKAAPLKVVPKTQKPSPAPRPPAPQPPAPQPASVTPVEPAAAAS